MMLYMVITSSVSWTVATSEGTSEKRGLNKYEFHFLNDLEKNVHVHTPQQAIQAVKSSGQ